MKMVEAESIFVWERAGCEAEDIPDEGLVPVMS